MYQSRLSLSFLHQNQNNSNDNFQTEGETVVIDGSNEKVEYRPMCGKCYVKRKYNS